MASSVWKGFLTFGIISVPVHLTAAARSVSLGAHLLHKKDNGRLHEQFVCSIDDKVVPRDEMVHGYEVSDDKYVVLEQSDIDKIKHPSSKIMEVLEFVPLDEVDPVYLDASYYAVPEEEGKKAYFLLLKTLQESRYVGVARLTMHQRENIIIIRPGLGGLIVHTLFYPNELRERDVKDLHATTVNDKELKMAQAFVETLAAKFDPGKYHDTYQVELQHLIDAKEKGKDIKESEPIATPSPATDLMAALKASIAAANKPGSAPAKPAKSAAPAKSSKPVSHRSAAAKRPTSARK